MCFFFFSGRRPGSLAADRGGLLQTGADARCNGASHVAGGRGTWLGDIRLAAVSLDSIYPGVDEPRFRPYVQHVAVSCTKPGEVYFDPLRMRRVVSRPPPPFRSPHALRASPRWRASDSPSVFGRFPPHSFRQPPTASNAAEKCQFSARTCVLVEAFGLARSARLHANLVTEHAAMTRHGGQIGPLTPARSMRSYDICFVNNNSHTGRLAIGHSQVRSSGL